MANPIRLASARTPSGNELVLYRFGREMVIHVDGTELMTSRVHGSEEELSRLGCLRASRLAAPRVLIGGLGMGFTLRAALDFLPETAEVWVAELVPEVVEWNRGPLRHYAGEPLADERVHVHVGDVGKLIAESADAFDAIMLDVDNGPVALTSPTNHWLYTQRGLMAAHRALRAKGTHAVWSSGPDPVFSERFESAGFDVAVHRIRQTGEHFPKHFVWIASRP